MNQQCPLALRSTEYNIRNHKKAVKEVALGPADPRQSNKSFWQDKASKWKCSEGDARGRLCANCEHFLSTTPIKQCIEEGPARKFKTSMVDKSFVDIESKPVAWCMLYDITCSPTRTCDSQEMGGPIDDARAAQLNAVDLEEYNNPFANGFDEE